jgi:hypothetical protein
VTRCSWRPSCPTLCGCWWSDSRPTRREWSSSLCARRLGLSLSLSLSLCVCLSRAECALWVGGQPWRDDVSRLHKLRAALECHLPAGWAAAQRTVFLKGFLRKLQQVRPWRWAGPYPPNVKASTPQLEVPLRGHLTSSCRSKKTDTSIFVLFRPQPRSQASPLLCTASPTSHETTEGSVTSDSQHESLPTHGCGLACGRCGTHVVCRVVRVPPVSTWVRGRRYHHAWAACLAFASSPPPRRTSATQ